MDPQLKKFITEVTKSISSDSFASISFMNKRDKSSELKTIGGKLIEIKKGIHLSLIYRYNTKDITKNYLPKHLENVISEILSDDFTQAILCTTTCEYHLSQKAKGPWKLTKKEVAFQGSIVKNHDKQKQRLIQANGGYLHGLEITTRDGKVRNDKQHKYRQINKFIELIDPLITTDTELEAFKIVDMGAGKGYLSFALYDHLKNNREIDVFLEAIEMRNHLVRDGNDLARSSGFTNLSFKEGTIENTPLQNINMVIALHACDTATDDAIFRGIKAGADVIVCSPCCHKQIRKQMDAIEVLSVITKHGILKERQAEIVTDTIRALLLQAYGYQTKVMEFVATEHTPKNLLITAVKTKVDTPVQSYLVQVTALKSQFGIKKQQLESLLLGM